MEQEANSCEVSRFVHLHNHTEYSLLDGACRLEELIIKAKELGMPAIAITDHGVMYGVVEFYKLARKHGLKPIIGCEVYVAPRSRQEKSTVEGEAYYHLILLAENDTGYRNLIELVSRAYTEGFYYKPRVDKELLGEYHDGLICLSACIAGEVPALILKGNLAAAERAAREYRDIFGQDNFFLEIQDHGLAEEKAANEVIIDLASRLGIGLVATNDIHYLNKTDSEFHDVLLCIQTGKTVDDADRLRFPSNEFYLKSEAEMTALFGEYPEALANTGRIADRCEVNFEFGHLHLPEFPVPDGLSADDYLEKLCRQNLPDRYPEDDDLVNERLAYELAMIKKMGYSGYFLIVWDFINYARTQNIPVGPGRGSAAGSIVAYLLGITNIDPLKYGLLFERFLNPERVTMPDIDIDLCYVKREKIIEYVASRYGADRVAQIITFGTMAAKAAIKDVGRALNMAYNDVDRIAKLIPNELGITIRRARQINKELDDLYTNNPEIHRLVDLAMAVEGLPRHASTHAAGLVIAREPLTHYVPLQNSADGFLTTQYDKDRVEELGLLKMDLLGLRTLTVIGDAVALIASTENIRLDIDHIPLADKTTCDMLANGDTAGVFQMESGGMTNLVKELRPESFVDLIPLVALYRPGPLGSGMVEDFINGRHGRKKVTYLHPLLEPILKDTFGVILYQEQVMQIASVVAGFSLGQADILRRAMGKKKPAVLAAQKDNFLRGAELKGISRALADEMFNLMAHFADYGFNKSHSAAYALVAYQTAYLKTHYPREFMAALLTSIMGANDKVSFYIEECRRMGIAILPPDVNVSGAGFSVDGEAIRFGLAGVKNVGDNAITSLIAARDQKGKFASLVDFCKRVDMRIVNKRVIESLIKCGAFDSFGVHRSQLLAVLDRSVDMAASWQREAASGQIGLFGNDTLNKVDEIVFPDLAEFPDEQLLAFEKEIIGFYVTGHPLDKYREKIKRYLSIDKLSELPDGRFVRVAGLVVAFRQVITKSGSMMGFATIEDLTGQVELVIFPRPFAKAGNSLMADKAVSVTGRVSRSDDAVKVMANEVRPLTLQDEVRIKINKEQENQEIFLQLKNALTRYQGKATVYLYLTDSRRIIKTEEDFWIEPSAAAVNALENILGSGTVSIL